MSRNGRINYTDSVVTVYINMVDQYRQTLKRQYYALLKRKGYTGISIKSFDSGNILIEAHKPKFCKFIDFQAERKSTSYPDESTMMDENEYNIKAGGVI